LDKNSIFQSTYRIPTGIRRISEQRQATAHRRLLSVRADTRGAPELPGRQAHRWVLICKQFEFKLAKIRAGRSATFQLRNETHANSALALYLQTNLEAARENVLCELVEQVANEQFFDQLRTKEQLGKRRELLLLDLP